MAVALFIPCYIDQLYPDVGIATVELLTRLGIEFEYPVDQTCCGQPMANTGCSAQAAPVARRFVKLFADFDTIVCPSGSCTAMVRHHYHEFFDPDDAAFRHVTQRTFELCEYLHDEVGLDQLDVSFPYHVSLHQSCHGLRELRLGPSSESMVPRVDKVRAILNLVRDVQWHQPQRPDECCGFGGTFAVNEADVSAAMGRDRIHDHLASGSQVLVSADMSCLMHLEGLIRRQHEPLTVMHVAQILAGRRPPESIAPPLPAASLPAASRSVASRSVASQSVASQTGSQSSDSDPALTEPGLTDPAHPDAGHH